MIKDTAKAVALWLGLFGTGISLMFLPRMIPWLSSFIFAVVFPLMIYLISSFPRFHVKSQFVMGAAIATFLFSTAIGSIKSVEQARKDPDKNYGAAAGYYVGSAVFFVTVMMVASYFTDLHKYKGNIPVANYA